MIFLVFSQRNHPITKQPLLKSVLAVSGNDVIAFSTHTSYSKSTHLLIWTLLFRMKSSYTCATGIYATLKSMIHWYWIDISAFTFIWPNWKRSANNCWRRNCCPLVWMIRDAETSYRTPVANMCACGIVASTRLRWLRIILSTLGFIVCTRWRLIRRAIGIKRCSVNGMWWQCLGEESGWFDGLFGEACNDFVWILSWSCLCFRYFQDLLQANIQFAAKNDRSHAIAYWWTLCRLLKLWFNV